MRRSLVLTVLAVVLLSLGTATAAKLITGGEIAKHTITGRNVKKGSIPLSALKGTVAGPAGPHGSQGAQGPRGEPGMKGTEGPAGLSAISEVVALNSAIDDEIAPSAQFGFIGTPASVEVFSGDVGQVTGTSVIGTTEGPIDSRIDFQVTSCFKFAGEPIEALVTEEEENTGKIGVSPVLGERTALTVASGFIVTGEFEGGVSAEVGPCLINATAKKLDDNGRVVGDVLVASG